MIKDFKDFLDLEPSLGSKAEDTAPAAPATPPGQRRQRLAPLCDRESLRPRARGPLLPERHPKRTSKCNICRMSLFKI